MALQVWLPLNGTLENKGLSNVTVTNNGATVDNNGKIGKCYYFNSDNSSSVQKYLMLNKNLSDILPTNGKSFSFACWIKITGNLYSNGCGLIAANQYNVTGVGLYIDNSTKKIHIHMCYNGTEQEWTATKMTALQNNVWYHVTYTYNEIGRQMTVYINGVNVDSTTANNIWVTRNEKISIGRGSQGGWGYTLPGFMNDVRIYDHCLSPKEVKEISKGLILHYKLDGNDIGITIPRNGDLIPDGVELYDYILSSGTLWINTGVNGYMNHRYELDYQQTTAGTFRMWGVFGQASYAGYNMSITWSSGRQVRWNSDSSGTQNIDNIDNYNNTDRHTFIIDKGQIYYDGVNKGKSSGHSDSCIINYPIYIFTVNPANTTPSYNTPAKVYSYKDYDASGTLIRNMLPCTYLGEPGMWDTVENKFYRNQGTGLFTLGSKITLKEYEYLLSSGTLWIDTNFIPKNNDKMEITFIPLNNSINQTIFGCRTEANNNSLWSYNIFLMLDSTLRLDIVNGASTYAVNTRYTLKYENSIINVNGTNITGPTRDGSSVGYKLYLFGTNTAGALEYLSSIKMYNYKQYSNGTLVRDFIPVSYNGTPGLWDKVEWKFYANAGSGSFTLGPEKTVQQDAPIFYDSSGYCNHGSITGTLTTNSDSPRYTASTVFNGSSYINAGRGAMVKDAISVCCWGYMSNWSNYDHRLLSCTESGGWNFEPSSGKMNFACGTGVSSNTYTSVASTRTLASLSSGWHHFVGTYDGFNTKIYIDGVLDGTYAAYTTRTPLYYNSTNAIFVGAEATTSATTGSSPFFSGRISDVRIYATALSEEDIKELYDTSAFVTNNGVFAEYELYEDNLSDVKKTGLLETANFYENGAESGYALDTDKTRVASNYIISEEFIEI